MIMTTVSFFFLPPFLPFFLPFCLIICFFLLWTSCLFKFICYLLKFCAEYIVYVRGIIDWSCILGTDCYKLDVSVLSMKIVHFSCYIQTFEGMCKRSRLVYFVSVC
jgi:hypothetical protein